MTIGLNWISEWLHPSELHEGESRLRDAYHHTIDWATSALRHRPSSDLEETLSAETSDPHTDPTVEKPHGSVSKNILKFTALVTAVSGGWIVYSLMPNQGLSSLYIDQGFERDRGIRDVVLKDPKNPTPEEKQVLNEKSLRAEAFAMYTPWINAKKGQVVDLFYVVGLSDSKKPKPTYPSEFSLFFQDLPVFELPGELSAKDRLEYELPERFAYPIVYSDVANRGKHVFSVGVKLATSELLAGKTYRIRAEIVYPSGTRKVTNYIKVNGEKLTDREKIDVNECCRKGSIIQERKRARLLEQRRRDQYKPDNSRENFLKPRNGILKHRKREPKVPYNRALPS
jgi:hypothetical protein